MELQVNGKSQQVDKENVTVLSLLEINQVKPIEMVAVQLNGKSLKEEAYASTRLHHGDKVDYLFYMGGGKFNMLDLNTIHV